MGISETLKAQERFVTCLSDQLMDPEREEVVEVKDRIGKSEYRA